VDCFSAVTSILLAIQRPPINALSTFTNAVQVGHSGVTIEANSFSIIALQTVLDHIFARLTLVLVFFVYCLGALASILSGILCPPTFTFGASSITIQSRHPTIACNTRSFFLIAFQTVWYNCIACLTLPTVSLVNGF